MFISQQSCFYDFCVLTLFSFGSQSLIHYSTPKFPEIQVYSSHDVSFLSNLFSSSDKWSCSVSNLCNSLQELTVWSSPRWPLLHFCFLLLFSPLQPSSCPALHNKNIRFNWWSTQWTNLWWMPSRFTLPFNLACAQEKVGSVILNNKKRDFFFSPYNLASGAKKLVYAAPPVMACNFSETAAQLKETLLKLLFSFPHKLSKQQVQVPVTVQITDFVSN